MEVKIFWFVKYEFSAFVCTKNHVKIFETRENKIRWKFEKTEEEKFFNKKLFEIPNIITIWVRHHMLMLSQTSARLIFAASNFHRPKTLDTSRCASLLSAHIYLNKPNRKAYSWILDFYTCQLRPLFASRFRFHQSTIPI